jgi:uncharacterized membrane protein
MMLYPTYVMAVLILPVQSNRWKNTLGVATIGGLIMTAWDLVLDPVMVARGHWIWESGGAYFGIPIQNYLGWWTTSFIILFLYGLLKKHLPTIESHLDLHFDRQAIGCYAITGLGSVFGALLAGLNGAAIAGFFAMLPWVLVSRIKRKFDNCQ